jgi:diacylglycerol kinase (ATP)
VVAALERRGCKVVLRSAQGYRDAERLARTAEPEFEAIVAAGGDGTINAVANGLAYKPQPLGILPIGTANVLACELGLPRSSEKLAALLAEAAARPVWPGRIGDRLFLSMAGIGFDAEVVAAVNPRLKRWIGRGAFVWAILLRLLRYSPRELSIRAEGVEYRATAAIAAKGRFYAGPFVMAPGGDLGEPVLHLVLFQAAGRIAAIRYLAALPTGRIPGLKSIGCLRVQSASLSAAEALPVHADGEIIGTLPAVITVAPHSIPVIRA